MRPDVSWIRRSFFAGIAAVCLLATVGGALAASSGDSGREATPAAAERPHSSIPEGFQPAVLAQNGDGRYFVTMDSGSVATAMRSNPSLSGSGQQAAADAADASQKSAIAATESTGGKVLFRYDTLINGFSAEMSPAAASELASRPDVAAVQPVDIVQREGNATHSPTYIGATKVAKKLGAKGQGIVVADVDTGIDYTHANFNGKGSVGAYKSNNPEIIEPGSFPTKKVIGGYDFVGNNYSVTDDDTSNDIPRPDPDPLDDGEHGDHGSHTAGTCCGVGVKGEIAPGVAPKSKLLAIKVWDTGDSTADVLVAGFERALDPNNDGKINDAADVLTFSGGVDYGTQNSVEALAAQRVVDLGTVFVAAAGNSGNQPVGGSAYIEGTPASAPGVISVAASIDDYQAQTITVNSPSIDLPFQGIMVPQDWAPPIPDGGLTDDLYDGRQLDPPASPGDENPADAMFCNPLPNGSLSGKVVFVFKGATSSGDCAGSQKAFNAQQAGAKAVILVSLFGGAPSALSSNGENITIPVVMVTAEDAYAILDELSPNANYNSGTVNATLNSEQTHIDAYTNAMTDFTSEGPARGSNDLKPDISAPGYNIQSTDAGTGNKGQEFSGTSMATPHVAGVAALLVQLHPKWSPDQIKAAIMNQADQDLKDNLLNSPVSATVIGSGLVDAYGSATTVSLASPASLSYGLAYASDPKQMVRTFHVSNVGKFTHTYKVKGGKARYSDFGDPPASVEVSKGDGGYAKSVHVKLKPGDSQKIKVQMTLDPMAIAEAEKEYGLYYFHPNVDGNVTIKQNGVGVVGIAGSGKGSSPEHISVKEPADTLHVPWHVAPLAASLDKLPTGSLDLTSGPKTIQPSLGGAGKSEVDLYQLGALDPRNSSGEEDIRAVGARSFTGSSVADDTPEGVPTGTDALGGIGWLDFLSDPDSPTEPVEFGVETGGVHNVTETLEVDVLVDAGADGVYAGSNLGIDADYLLVKQAAPGGEVCVFDLSKPDALDECAATYFADYSNYNSNLVGLVVNAGDIGVTDANPNIAYSVTACTGRYSGDAPSTLCDSAVDKNDNGVYNAKFNVTDPALEISPQTYGGFWDDTSSGPIHVAQGSAKPGQNPAILALFPQNKPKAPVIIGTETG